ncbi:hypothetical protein CJO70_23440 [Burkholderia ubonensis]|nr:hypothetical protein CJO70_23440 [Burkholderia ubonensis]
MYVIPPIVVPDVAFGAAVTDPDPSATSFAFFAMALAPRATPPLAAAVDAYPIAFEFVPLADAVAPTAIALDTELAPPPIDIAPALLATATFPIETEFCPFAVAA